jgi:uncharacterized protein YggE
MSETKSISVKGYGRIHVVPDVTRLKVTVESVFSNYDAAYKQAKENAQWMGQILEYNHLNKKQAKTIHFDISDHLIDEYDEDDHYIGKIKDGFELVQRFKIDLGIDNVLLNKIIRGVGKFIKGAQINIGYTVLDPRPHQLKMIERAVKDAKEKADIMAKAAECILGEVISIIYDRMDVGVYSEARSIHSNEEAKACNTNSLDIEPDDLVMDDNVNVTWQIIPVSGDR